MSKFEYPSLSRRDIVNVLADYQIATVSEADLINPNPDFISNLYTLILIHIDFLPEDHGQVDFAALEHFENPDLHIDSVRTMNLFHKIRELIAALDCPKKFTLKDLIKPDVDRTEFFLGAILNFFLHRHVPFLILAHLKLQDADICLLVIFEKMNFLGPLVDELRMLAEQRIELETRISQLNAEIAEYNESREREMPLVQEVDARVKELRQAIPTLNNHQMSLKASIRKIKEKAKEMDEKISSAEFALVQSAQENASLRSKIVQSPDKLQRALEEKRLIQVEAKNAERAAMQSFHDKTAILEVYTKACKKLLKHSAQMQDIQEQVNSAKLVEKDVKVLKVKLRDEEVLDKSLEANLANAINTKIYRVTESGAAKQQEIAHRCEELARE
ncbi:hypothetical protein RJ640_002353, partial [Escallonia rubra]